MAIDRKLKQKRKRQEKQKAAQHKRDLIIRRDKAEDCYWSAADALKGRSYREACDLAIKGLRHNPRHQLCFDMTLNCAIHLKDDDRIYEALRHGWSNGLVLSRHNALVFANISLGQSRYPLAIEVLEALLKSARPFDGEFSAQIRKEAKDMLAYCRSMNQSSTPAPREKSSPPQQPPAAKDTQLRKNQPPPAPPASEPQKKTQEIQAPLPGLEIVYAADRDAVLQVIRQGLASDPLQRDLALSAYAFSFRTTYDHLICLPALCNVRSLWYQEETARKVMRTFRGRAILADEVGLGKTVEACIVLKEYIMRGLVRSALILVPSSLVDQWQEELRDKLGLAVMSSNNPLFRDDPKRFWQEPFLLVSLQTARSKGHFDTVTGRSYDMVIVDEAHHLKNRATQNWKLVNSLRKTFLLLLTATPVQNNLEELYNLVTLLKPGHLKTRSAFMREFVSRANPTDPQNREKLRELLQEVMVRNTRSVTHLNLPPRFASTIRVSPSAAEAAFYEKVSGFVTRASAATSGIARLALRRLLEAAGSSHQAALRMLEHMHAGKSPEHAAQVRELVEAGMAVSESGKAGQVLDMLRASHEKILVFVNYRATLEYLERACREQGIPHAVYRGGMTPAQKQEAIDAFRDGCRVLLSTETGGEGHNMQFCHTMINYDLPWNPMRIEQRIGRIHRIGQEKEVAVYNFCAAGSIEDYVLDVLDRKINMFELVIGEIDMILGRLKDEQEFGDIVYDLWVNNPDESQRQQAFDELAGRLKSARRAHEKTKQLDDALFRENFEA